MAAHKRTKGQRDRELVKMAKMWVPGIPQSEISRRFRITQAQVSHDLKDIHQRLLPIDIQETSEAKKDRLLDLAVFKLE